MKKDLAHNPLIAHAGRELAAWMKEAGDENIYGEGVPVAVMELMHVFAGQGHSGASGPLILDLFVRLAQWQTLTPILGTDDEFVQVSNEGIKQNSRNSAVFQREDGKYYFIDAIIWRDEDNNLFHGKAGDLSSAQVIKSFPFTPKTFYIDVISREVAKDDWEYSIKNPDDLKVVWDYYEQQ